MALSWDANLANGAAAAEHCMKLGAVILKPKDKPAAGFAPPPVRGTSGGQ